MNEWMAAAFTPMERLYLGALLGVDSLGREADPLERRSLREIEMALYRTRIALTEHGVLQVDPDGSVTVAPWAADLLREGSGASAVPSATLRWLTKQFPYIFRTARRAPRPGQAGTPQNRAG